MGSIHQGISTQFHLVQQKKKWEKNFVDLIGFKNTWTRYRLFLNVFFNVLVTIIIWSVLIYIIDRQYIYRRAYKPTTAKGKKCHIFLLKFAFLLYIFACKIMYVFQSFDHRIKFHLCDDNSNGCLTIHYNYIYVCYFVQNRREFFKYCHSQCSHGQNI